MDVIVPQTVISSDHTDSTKTTLLSSSIAASSTSLWASGTTYATDDLVLYMDTSGTEAGIYKIYKSNADSNTGNNPYLTDGDKWISQGATERYKMFDIYTLTKTVDASNDIVINLHCRKCTAIAFLNVQAESIEIEMWKGSLLTDKTAGNKIYPASWDASGKKTISMKPKINNWYEYFFEDFDYTRDVSTPVPLKLLYNVVMQITFKKLSGQDCYVGQVLPGRLYNIGASQYDCESGIVDYSKIVEDETFGATYLAQGNYKKTLDVDLIVKKADHNSVNSILTQLRGVPTVWQGNQHGSEYDSLLIYGYCKRFRPIIKGPNHTEMNLEIRGMI